ncbi:MAG TPA: pyridoxamine 5'-phosphate oxidase family protein [Desulfuromonadales bacterium]|nr:pyridoxamine 5'-phosphate oxidase family protein [Desulfuromonadales bacterium]
MTDELDLQIRELLDHQMLGVLATSAGGHPYTTLVGFALGDHLREILFATHRATRKYANLQNDQRVTLLIDNRTNRAEDFRRAAALTAFGIAAEVPAEQWPEARRIFLARHPMLEQFVASPGCALCRVEVQRYSLVRRFQDVVELIFDETYSAP